VPPMKVRERGSGPRSSTASGWWRRRQGSLRSPLGWLADVSFKGFVRWVEVVSGVGWDSPIGRKLDSVKPHYPRPAARAVQPSGGALWKETGKGLSGCNLTLSSLRAQVMVATGLPLLESSATQHACTSIAATHAHDLPSEVGGRSRRVRPKKFRRAPDRIGLPMHESGLRFQREDWKSGRSRRGLLTIACGTQGHLSGSLRSPQRCSKLRPLLRW
jgi:hypothetical protein